HMGKTRVGWLLLCVTAALRADTILTENFDNVAGLSGNGWVEINNSTAPRATGWFQGNPSIFSAQSGQPSSYIAANFQNASFGGDISDWLITPALTIGNGDTLSFFTRTELGAPPD